MDQLPEGDEVIGILRDERAPLNTWVALAVSTFNNVNYNSKSFNIHSVFSFTTTSKANMMSLSSFWRYLEQVLLLYVSRDTHDYNYFMQSVFTYSQCFYVVPI